jgi:hypothetical protein
MGETGIDGDGMNGRSELDMRIARLEAALAAAAEALEATPPDLGPELKAARAELSEARARIEALEAAAASQGGGPSEPPASEPPASETARLRAAVEALTAASAELRAGAEGAVDRTLVAEVEALRAARAMDLAEMRTLLSELDPLLVPSEETADA